MPGTTRENKRPAPKQTLGERVRDLPAWLSAIAAIMGVAITALVTFGIVTNAGPAAVITPPPGAPAPRVTIETVDLNTQQVQGAGAFENIDPQSQQVLFVGRPHDQADALWVAVEASLAPKVQSGALVSGRWNAARPAPPPSPGYQWSAIVWPNSSGAAGNEDLQRNGPASQYVIARSEEWTSP